MIVYDDLETSEKVKIYDKGITVTETPDEVRKLLISYRTGDLWSPKVNDTEALRLEVAHFRECIQGGAKPLTPGERGLAIVRMLEAADEYPMNLGFLGKGNCSTPEPLREQVRAGVIGLKLH